MQRLQSSRKDRKGDNMVTLSYGMYGYPPKTYTLRDTSQT